MSYTNFPNGLTSHGVHLPAGMPPRGNEYYVKKITDTNYSYWFNNMNGHHDNGTEKVHTSIESAIAVADDFDTIWVYPGQWKPAETIAITQDSLKLLAVEQGPYGHCLTRTEIRQYDNVATPCISIEGAHNVEVAGFRITPYHTGANSYDSITLGKTANTYGAYIHNNYFYEVGSSTTGCVHIRMGLTANYNADSAFIYRNDFYTGGHSNATVAGQVDWDYALRAQIRECNFWQIGNNATSHAIRITDVGMPRGGIFDNRFMNVEENLTGSNAVAISNPAPAGGDWQIDGNSFINYSGEANCIKNESDVVQGLNYLNGSLINA